MRTNERINITKLLIIVLFFTVINIKTAVPLAEVLLLMLIPWFSVLDSNWLLSVD